MSKGLIDIVRRSQGLLRSNGYTDTADRLEIVAVYLGYGGKTEEVWDGVERRKAETKGGERSA